MSRPPVKKRKVSRNERKDDSPAPFEELEAKAHLAIKSSTSLNVIADLLELTISTSHPADTHKGIWSLYRVFSRLIEDGKLFGPIETANQMKRAPEAKVVHDWLSDRLSEFCDYLVRQYYDEEPNIRMAAWQISMALLKQISSNLSKFSSQPQMYMRLWRKIMMALLLGATPIKTSAFGHILPGDLRDAVLKSWLNKYDDVRWFFLRDAGNMLSQSKGEPSDLPSNLLCFLEGLERLPNAPSDLNSFWIPEFSSKPKEVDDIEPDSEGEEDDWRMTFRQDDAAASAAPPEKQKRTHTLSTLQSLHSIPSHQYQFSKCWLSLLPQLQNSDNFASRVLTILPRGVIPHLNRPVRLHDWVSSCVDIGGPVGLLALNGLFILIQQHHLDYPAFYTQLYGFLTSDVLHVKYRSRFFRLVDTFLSSTHLPAKLVASFAKRLSRLSLAAPPTALVTLIPFVYNLLKRHPTLMTTIHRHEEVDQFHDPFLAEEGNPNLTNAIDSSLWELVSHRRHYHPTVATMARVFEEMFTKPPFSLEDFLDHTYSTMFAAEAKRRLRSDPALANESVGQVFPSAMHQSAEAPGVDVNGDVVTELWRFS